MEPMAGKRLLKTKATRGGPRMAKQTTLGAQIDAYYSALDELAKQYAAHEGAVSVAFQTLLAETARRHHWTLIPQLSAKGIRPDGTLKDPMGLVRGHWEAKDTDDHLDAEICKKIQKGYETLEPWPLEWIETPGVPLSYRVEKMKLSKDKTTLVVNPSLTLAGIPPETREYRLGNRSALEWVIDQYQVSEDKRSGIKSDPNREDDEQYIVRLVGQVVRVSVETVKIVKGLPDAFA